MDVYLYVCEKLSESEFRRLRNFKPGGRATFSTWLTTVTHNLCIDWHRRVHGRRRPSATTAKFSALEMIVFRELYEAGTTKAECLNALPEEYAHITEHDLELINARIHAMLTPNKRWKLSNRTPSTLPLEQVSEIEVIRAHPDAANDDPQSIALTAEEIEQLEAAIATLDVNERLAIRLRFQEDLPFDQIARTLGINSKYRARKLINGAMSKIRRALSD